MAAAGSAHEVEATPGAPADNDARQKQIGESAIRKASLRLLPVIAVGYGLSYMDRINISFASLQMNRDLHLSA
jgi:MFS transporter, ACS family, tartrate transporter